MSVSNDIGQPEPTTSPMRNRVTPLGDIVAAPLRGGWLGNRGILHEGTDIVRFHRSNLWILCTLEYKDWRLPQWAEHHFTVLFFHDEAVAFAAGHRPCALCRRSDYNSFRRAWADGLGGGLPKAKDIDHELHGERIVRGTHRRRLHSTDWSAVPRGAFVLFDGQPALVLTEGLVPWSLRGYGAAVERPSAGIAALITPPSAVAAFRAGYGPQIDESALSRC
jgi:hypothetical protein